MTQMIGQKAPSVSLIVINNLEEQRWEGVLPFRETSTGWRNGLPGTSHCSAKRSAKSWWQNSQHLGRNNLTKPYRLGLTDWKASLQKGIWMSWWTPSRTWASDVCCNKDHQLHPSFTALAGVSAAGWRRWTPLCSALGRHILRPVLRSGQLPTKGS